MTDGCISRLKCYLVTDSRAGSVERLVQICETALTGGITTIQLRAPGWNDRQLVDAAMRLRTLTRMHGALFIVNDRADVAAISEADGVHLGVDDLPVPHVRRMLGPTAIIGYSPANLDDAKSSNALGATYLGVGPVYATTTKGDAGKAIGLTGIAAMASSVSLPVVGIGGISPETAAAVVAAGAVGVAVVNSVFLAADPTAEARRLAMALR